MQDVRGCYTASQLAINSNVGGVEHVADSHLARHRMTRFVHAAADRSMRMAIDDPRRDMQPLAVNHRRAAGCFQSRADCGNLAGCHEQVGILQRAWRTGSPDRGALNQHTLRLVRRRRASERARRIRLRKIQRLIERRRFFIRLFRRGKRRGALRVPAKIRRRRRIAGAGNCFADDLAG